MRHRERIGTASWSDIVQFGGRVYENIADFLLGMRIEIVTRMVE
jgi:hypothetical protein